MASQSITLVALLCIVILSLVSVSFVEADCRWTGCHAHSAGDWCDVLGPGYKLKRWQRCNGIFGKQEYCCN
ncbi:uncharacterized protein LOC100680439 [Nasonia vitripennis]|uniref:Uncharacterized protein n=1 Tax=Nasonia vitripennis TaxID=7425 RepID=K7JHL0_NASVI|nr:uncharacterized protein LOC100680416 [Nasonia vitripennis]XP_003423907.1 uncharacterized protein LOC100680439 [Nasonia vitripennis]